MKKLTHEEYIDRLRLKNIFDIIPIEKYKNSTTKILHKNLKCGHEWLTTPGNILTGHGCPICTHHGTQRNVNDMWTTHPNLANLLANAEDGYTFSYSSNHKVDWRCPDCGHIIKNKEICNIYKQGLSCPFCADGNSIPNKFMYNVLSSLNLSFSSEYKFQWSQNKRYDFYIFNLNCIIEMHGIQHYVDNHHIYNSDSHTFEDQQKTDALKQKLAVENNINHYIIIDSSQTDPDWLTKNIKSSELNDLLNLSNVQWCDCYRKANNSKLVEVCKFLNKGYTISEVIKLLGVPSTSARRYARRGKQIGICNYIPDVCKKVICLTTNEVFDSIKEANLKYNVTTIGYCCRGKYKTSGQSPITGEKLKWQFYNEYLTSVQPDASSI